MEVQKVKEQLKELFRTVINNEKWITIHPHGEESDDYRRIKLEDGETPKEAIDRVYKKEEQKETSKEETKETSIEKYLTDKSDSGFLYQSKGTNTYTNGEKRVEVEEFGKDGGKYRVVFYDGGKRKDIKAYSTKRGMEKAVKSHLQGDNKEAKALETKTDLSATETKYKEVLKRYNDNNSKRWQSGLSNEEYYKAYEEAEKAKKELTSARREFAESIMSNFEKVEDNPYEEKLTARRDRYTELAEQAQQTSNRYAKSGQEMFDVIPFGQPIHGQSDRNYRDRAWGKFEQSWKQQEKADYYENKAKSVGKAGISADDANAIAKLAEKYKSGVTSAEKRRIIDRVIDIYKNKQMAADTSKPTDYSELGFQVKRNSDINRLQLKFDGKPDENTRSILKSNGFRWSPKEGAWQRQLGGNSEYGLKRVIEKLKTVNNSLLTGLDDILTNSNISEKDSLVIEKINDLLNPNIVCNSKEDEMTLLDDIKNLICKVENGKEYTMVNNEKVDKRKLIDEVAGIMKSAGCDDEVIRTAIGKMEKIGYDKSDADTADNQKDDKVDNKCVKNKDAEDEKEVKEVKEEVKEDVENCGKKGKVDNSKTDYFARLNEIYNSVSSSIKEEPVYVSRADREQAADDYFRN